MDNKEENSNLVETRSGVRDQTESVPAVGAGVEESKVIDPNQAEPLPGVTVGSHGSKELPWAAALETAEGRGMSDWILEW